MHIVQPDFMMRRRRPTQRAARLKSETNKRSRGIKHAFARSFERGQFERVTLVKIGSGRIDGRFQSAGAFPFLVKRFHQ
jgi:hypothetical protein